ISSAVTGPAKNAAVSMATAVTVLTSTLASQYLLIERDRRQVLVEIMAWADLPTLHICVIGYHPVPPQQENFVRFGVEHVFLEVAHQCTLLHRIGLAQHLVVKIDLLGVLEVSVVCRIDR